MAQCTGLEPATPGVTGRYSNRLNYHSALIDFVFPRSCRLIFMTTKLQCWRPHGDSNPGYRRERAVS